MARNANGRKLWKVKGGTQTYGQWQEAKLAETGVVAGAEGADED